ncbi:DUF3179 domain-containing protein [Candidatus Gracilibacteria bacterium]|nr:DUF3179 domain-containing protein [Candidatus Gracilibacteria bacterium]
MTLIVIAFFSGVLTVLAPCVLPLLPIVMGASAEDGNNKKIPLVIISSLSLSIIIFSLILKASTVLIGVPPSFWKAFSGGMIIALGIITIFPNLWKNISTKLGFSGKSNELLHKSNEKKGMSKYIFMGFALGPVFSSCSPTYALILAIILPAGFTFGLLALVSYTFGLAVILFAIAIFGQKLIKNLKWASDPNGLFKKILGVIFILVGLAILTGYDKKIEAAILDAGFLNTTIFEQSIINELELDDLEPSIQLSPQGRKSELQGFEVSSLPRGENGEGGTCSDGMCGKEIEGSLSFLDTKSTLGIKDGEIVADEGYEAPEFQGLTDWINTDGEMSMQNLEGNVVLLDFWNASCPNCAATASHTQELYDTYKDSGLVVLGIHTPEFAYERERNHILKKVQASQKTYPIALDNNFETWKRYNNNSWPAFYLIDANGNIRYTHFGVGDYDNREQAVQELLGENDSIQTAPQFLFQADRLSTNTAKNSIDIKLVLDGGPGKDGIPAIDTPTFISQQDIETQMQYLGENSRGIVLDVGGEQKFYPYDILVWHEIVNDEIGDQKVAITFCPLCGSAIVYDREVNDREIDFGVSGKLYNSNLLMYDTYDETLWSQSLGEAVIGDQLGEKLTVVKSELMTYSEFQNAFPEGVVLSDDTGFNRNYGIIPYGDYDNNDELYFPIENDSDTRFFQKELFYIVNNGTESVAFLWDDLRENGEAEIVVGDNTYTAKFSEGLADVSLNSEILPGYFEMWFSWINNNPGNKNVWSI